MKYRIDSMPVSQLVELIRTDHLDLKPYYQRNDVWSKGDQNDLVESITKGYPLPNFFLFERQAGFFEMVDGQQRSRTIYRFFSGEIALPNGNRYKDINKESFNNYLLSVTYIFDIEDDREIEEFYVLVNRKGKHLTKPELFKAEYAQSNFLQLVEGLLSYQPLVDLNLFTEASAKRMNDRDFIEELVAYLMHGIQDKKSIIEDVYEKDVSTEERNDIETRFMAVIDKIARIDKFFPINKTRLKQRNDFYSLFNFVHRTINEPDELLMRQYKSFLLFANYISPSNHDCPTLREYAIHCVSQSNSKRAREERLRFFEAVLLNKSQDISINPSLSDIANYLEEAHGISVTAKDNSDNVFLLERA